MIKQMIDELGWCARPPWPRATGPTSGYELTAAGREELQRWVDDPLPAVRVRDTFFSKLPVAWETGLADPVV
jgi:hypothetical protein